MHATDMGVHSKNCGTFKLFHVSYIITPDKRTNQNIRTYQILCHIPFTYSTYGS